MQTNRQTIIIVAGLIIALLAGMFIFAQLKKAEYERRLMEDAEVEETTEPFTVSRIDAKHYYTEAEGVHTIAGELVLPTPCDLLDTNVAIIGEAPGRAVVSFDIINNADGECAKVPTPQRFKVGFTAPQETPIEATWKGEPVELNLVPAAEGESPADFELYIKG